MLNNAQHIAKMGAWELNLETGKVYWSDETFLIHELKPSGNVAIEDAISFYHPDDRAIISEALQKTIKTKEPFDVVCRLLTYKNRNIWARSSGFAFVENNKVTKLYGMIQDITQFELDKLAIEREQLFSKQVIESMVDGFSIHSKDGSKLDVNDAFCKMTGFKREDFVGLKPPFKNWPIDSLDNIQKTIENIISIGSGTAEFIFQKKDGTRFPVLTTTSVLKNSNGEVEYYFTNSKDITKQKKAEEDLINKEKRLLQIIKATRIGTWEWNIKSGEILINERWGKTSGYSLNELNPFTIKKWVDLIFPDDLIAFNQKLEECFSKKFEFFECEVRVLHKKEYWVWTLVKGKVFEWSNNGEALHMFGTQENITERKQAEAQLKRNMFELQSLSEQLEFEKKQLSFALNENQAIMHALDQSAMVTIADLKGNIIEANEFFCRNSGFTKSELIGNNHRMINSGVHSKLFWKSMWDTILSGNTWTGEVCNKTKDGKLYWVNAINTPVFDSKNKIYKFLSIRYAITERKEAEEEQKRLQDITQNQNDRLKQFAYIVSHNLRSHSGNIQLLLEFLLNDKPELGENQVFKYVKSASTNLIDTIKHLAEVAHLHNNKPKDLQSLNLHQYIEQAFSNVVAFATKDDTSLINEVDPNLSIIATTTYIESILLNFVSNGIKYRNPDAQSFVKLTSEVLPNSKFIRLSIIDNGLGIDLNLYRSKLFGLYQTFHKNKEAKGIGLFITKNQIEAIGGSVEVDSKPGVGTTFSILLKRDDTV